MMLFITTNLITQYEMTRHEYTRDEIIPVLILKKEGYSNMKISSEDPNS